MRQFCEEQGIKQTTPYTTSHAPHVERVQGTLQNLIYVTGKVDTPVEYTLTKTVSVIVYST